MFLQITRSLNGMAGTPAMAAFDDGYTSFFSSRLWHFVQIRQTIIIPWFVTAVVTGTRRESYHLGLLWDDDR